MAEDALRAELDVLKAQLAAVAARQDEAVPVGVAYPRYFQHPAGGLATVRTEQDYNTRKSLWDGWAELDASAVRAIHAAVPAAREPALSARKAPGLIVDK